MEFGTLGEGYGYSLVHFLMHWHLRSLPWQPLTSHENHRRQLDQILASKVETPIEELCQNCPTEFATYLRYCRRLRFDETPDYAYVRRIFTNLFVRLGFEHDSVYDWSDQMPPPSSPPFQRSSTTEW